jgi:hypothetical protein
MCPKTEIVFDNNHLEQTVHMEHPDCDVTYEISLGITPPSTPIKLFVEQFAEH